MFYVKAQIHDGNVFTRCPGCGRADGFECQFYKKD